MKKFKCTVTRIDEFIIELDENVINEEYNKEFRESFYPFYDLENHAEHLAQYQARFGDEDGFVEGYGNVLRDGKLPFSFSDYNKDGSKKSEEELRKPCSGINIITRNNPEECDVEVEEVMK